MKHYKIRCKLFGKWRTVNYVGNGDWMEWLMMNGATIDDWKWTLRVPV